MEGLGSDRLERVAMSVYDPRGKGCRFPAAVNCLSSHIFFSVIPSPQFSVLIHISFSHNALCAPAFPTPFYALPQALPVPSHISLSLPDFSHSSSKCSVLSCSASILSPDYLSVPGFCFSPKILCGASVEGVAYDAALVALNGKCDLGNPQGNGIKGEVGFAVFEGMMVKSEGVKVVR